MIFFLIVFLCIIQANNLSAESIVLYNFIFTCIVVRLLKFINSETLLVWKCSKAAPRCLKKDFFFFFSSERNSSLVIAIAWSKYTYVTIEITIIVYAFM